MRRECQSRSKGRYGYYLFAETGIFHHFLPGHHRPQEVRHRMPARQPEHDRRHHQHPPARQPPAPPVEQPERRWLQQEEDPQRHRRYQRRRWIDKQPDRQQPAHQLDLPRAERVRHRRQQRMHEGAMQPAVDFPDVVGKHQPDERHQVPGRTPVERPADAVIQPSRDPEERHGDDLPHPDRRGEQRGDPVDRLEPRR